MLRFMNSNTVGDSQNCSNTVVEMRLILIVWSVGLHFLEVPRLALTALQIGPQRSFNAILACKLFVLFRFGFIAHPARGTPDSCFLQLSLATVLSIWQEPIAPPKTPRHDAVVAQG